MRILSARCRTVGHYAAAHASPLGRGSAGLRHYAPSHLLQRCSASYQHLRCAAGQLQTGLTRPYRSPQASVQRRKLFPAPINLRCRTPFGCFPTRNQERTAFPWVRGRFGGGKPPAAIFNDLAPMIQPAPYYSRLRQRSSGVPSCCGSPSTQNSPPGIQHKPLFPLQHRN